MPLRVEIVTPTGVAFEGEVESLSAPGYLGEFGVLPGHEQLLSLVRPGRVVLQTAQGPYAFVVGAGFAEVGPDHLSLLADHCEEAGSVPEERARQELAEAEAELLRAQAGTPGWERAERRVELARARLLGPVEGQLQLEAGDEEPAGSGD